MKFKEIKRLSKEDRKKKLKDLRLELIKSGVGAAKVGNTKAKEIKKAIARILTIKN